MQRKTVGAIVALVTTSLLSIHAIADTSPEDAADYRGALMMSLRGHIAASSMIARGLVENDGYLVMHAQGLANSAKELHRVFPEGSNVGESEALPAIWENPEDFAAAIAKVEEATAAFVTAAEGGDEEAIMGAFRAVGGSCRGCHDNFRVAQD
jgi:cytochrome c556